MGGTVFEILPVWKRCLYFILFSHFHVWLDIGDHLSSERGRHFFLSAGVWCAFERPDDAILFTLFSSLMTGLGVGSVSLTGLVLFGPFRLVESFPSVFFVLFFLELLLYGSWTF